MKRKLNVDLEESRSARLLFNRPEDVIDDIKSKEITDLPENLKPAWIDEDDNIFVANAVMDTKSKDLYSNTLKQKYVNLMGTPNWAKLDRKLKRDSEDEDEILQTVGHLQKVQQTFLGKGILELKRFPKINKETGNEGPIIKSVEFHPKSSVALVGGQSGVVSLFTVGGDTNNKLHSFQLPKFRLLGARFTPSGSEAILLSDFSHEYYVYNLVKAESRVITFTEAIRRPTAFELSPCGKYLAIVDGFEIVNLLCANSKELLRSLKHNSKVEAITFSPNSDKLYSFGKCGQVTIWDLSMYRVTQKFADHGCVTGSCITMSSCGRLLATGSGEGIVNIYDCKDLTTSSPVPQRTIENLRTKITCLKFNSTTEMLQLSSSFYPNAIRLVHIPSYHVFSNFPNQTSKLHQVAGFNFSPSSGYMALTNNKNSAYLYRLKHFKNY